MYWKYDENIIVQQVWACTISEKDGAKIDLVENVEIQKKLKFFWKELEGERELTTYVESDFDFNFVWHAER